MSVSVRVLPLLMLLTASPALAGKKKKPKDTPPSAPAAAAPAEAPITLPCDWPVGTAFTYTAGRARTDTRQPLLAQVTTKTPITVTVTASGNPTSLDWTT